MIMALDRFEGLPFDELTNANASHMRIFKSPETNILIDGANILGDNFNIAKRKKKLKEGIKWY